MTDEQKRFKIQKIESYKEQISQEDKELTKKTFLLGFTAVAAVCVFVAAPYVTDDTLRFTDIFMGVANISFIPVHLKRLIESISKKTNLQSKIDDINNELEMSENEEKSRGMRRW